MAAQIFRHFSNKIPLNIHGIEFIYAHIFVKTSLLSFCLDI